MAFCRLGQRRSILQTTQQSLYTNTRSKLCRHHDTCINSIVTHYQDPFRWHFISFHCNINRFRSRINSKFRTSAKLICFASSSRRLFTYSALLAIDGDFSDFNLPKKLQSKVNTISNFDSANILLGSYDYFSGNKLGAFVSNRTRSVRSCPEGGGERCAHVGESVRSIVMPSTSDCRDQDFISCFVAIRKRESSKDIHWSRLVDAGVIDALCECVIHAKTRPLDPISLSRLRIETSVWPPQEGKVLNN